MSGYFKLAKWANLNANINLHIDRSYKLAHEYGICTSEAFSHIGPAAGVFVEPDVLKASEYNFLITSENFELISDIGLVEERAINLHHLFKLYSTMQIDFQTWLDNLPGFDQELDGPVALAKIPSKYKHQFEFKSAQLNQIITGIIEHLESDIDFSTKTTQKFIQAAYEQHKPHFPKMEFRHTEVQA